MDKAGLVLIDADTEIHKILIERSGYAVDVPFIGYPRGDYAHIDSAFCGISQCGNHLVIGDKIRRGDIDIVVCVVDDVHIDKLADVLVIKR